MARNNNNNNKNRVNIKEALTSYTLYKINSEASQLPYEVEMILIYFTDEEARHKVAQSLAQVHWFTAQMKKGSFLLSRDEEGYLWLEIVTLSILGQMFHKN